ncbi:MAG TPA: glycosyltransferase family 39 protein [Anaerolineae bacterium]|nr:glycosyltransferase family 39 protein [Anaerolineae bacterium]
MNYIGTRAARAMTIDGSEIISLARTTAPLTMTIWRVWLPVFIVLGSWGYYLAYFNYGLTMNDEGFLLENAMRVLVGQLPLHDFYGYPPLRYFYLSGWFELFGQSLLIERMALLFIRVLTPLLMFLLARRILSIKAALVPTVMVALVAGPWEKTFDTFLPILNAFLLVRYFSRPTWQRSIVSGIAIGLAVFIKQDLGVAMFIVETLVLWVFSDGKGELDVRRIFSVTFDRVRRIGIYFGAVAVGLAPVLVVYTSAGVLANLLTGLLTPVSVEQTFASSFFQPLMQFSLQHPRAALEAFLVYLSLVILVSFPIVLLLRWRREGVGSPVLASIWLVACVAYPITFLIPYFSRLTQTGPLCYLLGTIEAVWFIQWAATKFDRRTNWARLAPTVLTVFLLLIPLAFIAFALADNNMYIGSIAIRLNRTTRLQNSIAPIFDSPPAANATDEMTEYVVRHTASGQYIFASFDHGFYFLTQRQNPTGVYFLPQWLAERPASQEQFLQDLAKNPPQVLIRRTDELEHPNLDSQWWDIYVTEHYALKFQNAQYVLYEPMEK